MLINLIRAKLAKALATSFPEVNVEIEVTAATAEKFGHYQVNSAMKLAKTLGKNPREIALKIVSAIEDDEKMFATVDIAGAGFINLTLSASFLSNRCNALLQDPFLGCVSNGKKQKVIVEFSSPNTAKEMHVGHLRSTIIGDSIARLFEFLDYEVLRINHVGDWGTQFGMLIAYMQEAAAEVLSGQKATDLPTLMQWYKLSKKRFDEDEAFKTKARGLVVALQAGRGDVMEAWQRICEISRKGYGQVYELLDVELHERGESFYNPQLGSVVADLEKKGLVTISEGAKCVFHEGYSIPLMVQKTDGGYNYDTTDMAAMKYRVETDKADRIIVLTDAGQSLHFKLVYETSVKAHYLDPQKVRFDHVTFGVVLGPDGKKFRTRSGETERLIDLLEEGIAEAKKILEGRTEARTPEEKNTLATVIGIDAIKYADLSSNRSSDYMFSYERMLRFEGNTATFILYSYVRVNGIKRKTERSLETLLQTERIKLEHPSEIALAVHLLRFAEIIEVFVEDLYPHILTDYLFHLANAFNAFFRDCHVIGTPEEASRLLLSELTAKILRQGLEILGIKVVERL